MSGFEILGIAASIIQIADIGAKISTKLCTFYHQVKNVNDSVQSLSTDVALTSNILRQLGETLQQDEQAKVCSQQALDTAKEVLKECKKVFGQISGAIDQPDQNDAIGRIRRAARKFGLALIERDLETFRSNLERLKSTMLLMLNVIMYAEDIRKRAEYSILQDHRDVIRALVQQQDANNKRFDEITCAITLPPRDGFQATTVSPRPRSPGVSTGLDSIPEELQNYYSLLQKVLKQVDACKYDLKERRYLRVRNGIVDVHAAELVRLELQYGRENCQIFDNPLFESKASIHHTSSMAIVQSRLGRQSSSSHEVELRRPMSLHGSRKPSRGAMSHNRVHTHRRVHFHEDPELEEEDGEWIDSTDDDDEADDDGEWLGTSLERQYAARLARLEIQERKEAKDKRDQVDPVDAVVLSWTTLKGAELPEAFARLKVDSSRRSDIR